MSRSIGYKTFQFVLSGVNQRLSATKMYCYGFEIYADVSNSGIVYTGDELVGSLDGRPIGPGRVFSPPEVHLGSNSDEYDLSKIWVVGTLNDTIRVIRTVYTGDD